jgi:putative transposase
MTTETAVHERRSIRLKGYDYSQASAYFITICTHQREHLFGEIIRAGVNCNAPHLLDKS